MDIKNFTYQLPRDLIAQKPVGRRDRARLMVIDRKNKTIRHDCFSNIGTYLPKESVIVLNDSKVVPARLFGKREKTGGRVEIFLLNPMKEGYRHRALIRPLKKNKIDEKIVFDNNGLYAQLKDVKTRTVQFNKRNIVPYLEKIGRMPLPPYIKRSDNALDKEYYQTVYARKRGSVAAPTAGLHFTKDLLGQLKKQGHALAKVTLHVNYATFKPVEEKDITRHKMHTESFDVSKKTWETLKGARAKDKKIVAVGTTACRVLETLGRSKRLSGETDLFVYPGYQFRMTDILITNFHLPCSTLLMLVYAFGGVDLMKRAYKEAIKEKYRFYSYGDAMVIV